MFLLLFTVWLTFTAVAVLSAVLNCDYRAAATIYIQLRVCWCGGDTRREREGESNERKQKGRRRELKLKRESKE